MPDPLAQLQQRLAYTFQDPRLLACALTHPSFQQDHADHTDPADNNQRLEFLGDAVLQLILTEALYNLYPSDREGALSQRRSALVKGKFLSDLARALGMPAALRLSTGEETAGGRERNSALEDAFEALIGAIYLDSNLATTRRIILGFIGALPELLAVVQPAENPKGQLQELIQPTHGNNALRYDVVHISGQDHAREYEATVYLLDQPLGSGRGSSKKAAEEVAARHALDSLKDTPSSPTTDDERFKPNNGAHEK